MKVGNIIFYLFISLSIFGLNLTATAETTPSVSVKAYAPENIWTLSVADQIRVLENEYRDQSGGRMLPDDQLDFYLDQIKLSRWTFSHIKNDMAASLRGNNWKPPSSIGWQATNVICSSNSQRYTECRTPFSRKAKLIENISSTRCVEGMNWGSKKGLVWVDNGCRGRFVDSGYGFNDNNYNNGSYGNSNSQTFRCESYGGRYQECRKPYSRSNGNVVLIHQLSNNPCIEGNSWGNRKDVVWVSNGCRAEFRIKSDGYNNSNNNLNNNYTVTCSSYNGVMRTCSWNRSQGIPRLTERLAGRCMERVDWGYDSRGLWVNNSCSARFGVR